MTPAEPRACTACLHHQRVDGRHTCMHPPMSRPLTDPETGGITTVTVHVDGEVCDTVRKMYMPCGPAGNLWEPAKA